MYVLFLRLVPNLSSYYKFIYPCIFSKGSCLAQVQKLDFDSNPACRAVCVCSPEASTYTPKKFWNSV